MNNSFSLFYKSKDYEWIILKQRLNVLSMQPYDSFAEIEKCPNGHFRMWPEKAKRTHFHKKIPDKYNTDPVFDKI